MDPPSLLINSISTFCTGFGIYMIYAFYSKFRNSQIQEVCSNCNGLQGSECPECTANSTDKDTYRNVRYCHPISAPNFKKSVFCGLCITNQNIVLNILQNHDEFETAESSNSYRASLLERYPPVCVDCEPRVNSKIQERNSLFKSPLISYQKNKAKDPSVLRKLHANGEYGKIMRCYFETVITVYGLSSQVLLLIHIYYKILHRPEFSNGYFGYFRLISSWINNLPFFSIDLMLLGIILSVTVSLSKPHIPKVFKNPNSRIHYTRGIIRIGGLLYWRLFDVDSVMVMALVFVLVSNLLWSNVFGQGLRLRATAKTVFGTPQIFQDIPLVNKRSDARQISQLLPDQSSESFKLSKDAREMGSNASQWLQTVSNPGTVNSSWTHSSAKTQSPNIRMDSNPESIHWKTFSNLAFKSETNKIADLISHNTNSNHPENKPRSFGTQVSAIPLSSKQSETPDIYLRPQRFFAKEVT